MFADLGEAPPSNAYLSPAAADEPERRYPLRVLVCESCWLVQTEDFARADELFQDDYAYFSSYSASWVAHAKRYVDDMAARFGLGADSHMVEIAANDGYLLQFAKARGIPCLGVEPTAHTAEAARGRGVPIVQEFFGADLARRLAAEGASADLMTANNVLAHVPDINDFVAGFGALLKPEGVATFEFPHLLRLVAERQFDTLYHEHFSYLSLTSAASVFASNGLSVFDVEEWPTHGGSLRVFVQRADTGRRQTTKRVASVLGAEAEAGVRDRGYYAGFQASVEAVKDGFVEFLQGARAQGAKVAAYGAAAKGNTLMNYAGVTADQVLFVVDRNPAKQGRLMPGSRIPIVEEGRLRESRPDYVVILPWNLKDEIAGQLGFIREWGGRLVTAVPELRVW